MRRVRINCSSSSSSYSSSSFVQRSDVRIRACHPSFNRIKVKGEKKNRNETKIMILNSARAVAHLARATCENWSHIARHALALFCWWSRLRPGSTSNTSALELRRIGFMGRASLTRQEKKERKTENNRGKKAIWMYANGWSAQHTEHPFEFLCSRTESMKYICIINNVRFMRSRIRQQRFFLNLNLWCFAH